MQIFFGKQYPTCAHMYHYASNEKALMLKEYRPNNTVNARLSSHAAQARWVMGVYHRDRDDPQTSKPLNQALWAQNAPMLLRYIPYLRGFGVSLYEGYYHGTTMETRGRQTYLEVHG